MKDECYRSQDEVIICDRFWMALVTILRIIDISRAGSALRINALPDTIILAPACTYADTGNYMHWYTKLLSVTKRICLFNQLTVLYYPLSTLSTNFHKKRSKYDI